MLEITAKSENLAGDEKSGLVLNWCRAETPARWSAVIWRISPVVLLCLSVVQVAVGGGARSPEAARESEERGRQHAAAALAGLDVHPCKLTHGRGRKEETEGRTLSDE